MKKKVWVSLILTAVMLATVACGNNAAKGTNDTTGSDAASKENGDKKSYKIAISQIVEHPSLDATREGFLQALKDAGIVEGENLKVDYNNAQNDQTNNMTIAQKINSGDADLVLAIATPSAQAVVKEVKDKSILFAAVTDPLDAKLVTNLEKPGGNISGVSDTNPEAITKLMDFIAGSFPNVKNLGLVINEGESNAVMMAKLAEEALSKHGIKLVKVAITNTSEVKQAAESLIGRVDALYITLDNSVVSGADAIIQVAKEKHLPFFSSDRDTVEKGAFATVGFKYFDHGYQVGQMAVDILKNGKKPGDMPITVQQKLDIILNLKAAADQGIVVTDEMKAQVQDAEKNIIQ
ncbi:ABC transporter substrate-binding protein [Paenibacillus macquariensis]|uniref:ABC transport system substrate-binding protein n=1 Tax=Paenibacillus macquariensis TaxID=948756 RepID=A0ABY1JZC9_9BACL|nr:ABC transporter substrate-binding protein [Paenibacillus macquariensis]MEC0091271.1 ABC transporter substrate-binding protein [Paenibacillus macquariensis]OAB37965.1 sugar ABC transporter substrate-binding protein [Paenibacillus macquariensis subsp. macquariensis]SIR03274.1 putative ABC transport system substrate-binding protein [Paenibacillus macquariensis]